MIRIYLKFETSRANTGEDIDLALVRNASFCFFITSWINFVPLVFRRKDLCEAKHETQSVFKFSDVVFALSQMDPP